MAERNEKRRQLRKEKTQAERIELYVADYVKHKYKAIYDEATQYFSMLRQHNPWKLNLMKSEQYRRWVKQQVNEHPQQVNEHPQQVNEHPHQVQTDEQCFSNSLQLEIPLMDSTTIKEKTKKTTSTVETFETVMEEIIGEGDIQPSLKDEIPFDLIEQVMEELKQCPELENIFDELDIGMNIDISDDDRLEKELL